MQYMYLVYTHFMCIIYTGMALLFLDSFYEHINDNKWWKHAYYIIYKLHNHNVSMYLVDFNFLKLI